MRFAVLVCTKSKIRACSKVRFAGKHGQKRHPPLAIRRATGVAGASRGSRSRYKRGMALGVFEDRLTDFIRNLIAHPLTQRCRSRWVERRFEPLRPRLISHGCMAHVLSPSFAIARNRRVALQHVSVALCSVSQLCRIHQHTGHRCNTQRSSHCKMAYGWRIEKWSGQRMRRYSLWTTMTAAASSRCSVKVFASTLPPSVLCNGPVRNTNDLDI